VTRPLELRDRNTIARMIRDLPDLDVVVFYAGKDELARLQILLADQSIKAAQDRHDGEH
jgi:hypothetical protein